MSVWTYSSSPSEAVQRMALPGEESDIQAEISQCLQSLKGRSSEISIWLQRRSHQVIPLEWGSLLASSALFEPAYSQSRFKEMMQAVINELDGLLTTILIQELGAWKTEQIHAKCIEMVRTKSLDSIESWVEDLTEIIWNTGEQLQEAERVGILEITPLQLQIKGFLEALVANSLVVVDQPYQVVKKGTKFPKTITLRLLCGSIFKYLKIDLLKIENQPKIEMSLVNDVQARYLAENNTIPTKISGTCEKNSSKLEYYPKSSFTVCAMFRNALISIINDDARKGSSTSPKTDAVTDTKFCLHFYCEFQAADFQFKTSTMTHPLVVTTHGSQDSQAWATIHWDNAFSDKKRLPFEVPSKITWPQLIEMISYRYKVATGGQCLSKESLMYLKDKIVSTGNGGPSSSEVISWTRFCKSIIPERNFSFWDWIYATMRLADQIPKEFWREGYIKGFIGKTDAEDLVALFPPGTFLLRFSETIPGAISIVYVNTDGNVESCAPFTYKQLKTKSLADTLKDFVDLKWLYPSIPKQLAFGNYYSKEVVSRIPSSQGKGYVRVISKLIGYCTSATETQASSILPQPIAQPPTISPTVTQSFSIRTTTTGNPHSQFSDEQMDIICQFDDGQTL